MNINTFGDSSIYNMLYPLTIEFEKLDDKSKRKVSRLIISFNTLITNIELNNDYKKYILKLVECNYIVNTNKMRCDNTIKSYIINYIKAKVNNNIK